MADEQGAGKSFTTTDRDTIRRWAEERGGKPARVKGTGNPGILRINFPGSDDSLEDVSWEEFFAAMDERNLAFLYQERKADGELSTFSKLVDRSALREGAAA